MAHKEEIEFFISEEGEIKFHVKGIKGAGCLDIAKDIGKSLGKVKEVDLTSEYYEKQISKGKTKQIIQ